MSEATKKHNTDEDMITIRLPVHRSNAPKIKEFAETVEAGDEQNYTVAEVFPEYLDKDKHMALRAYSYRENLTQRQLAELSGILRRHISEMETGKRLIGKEMAKRLSKIMKADYQMFL